MVPTDAEDTTMSEIEEDNLNKPNRIIQISKSSRVSTLKTTCLGSLNLDSLHGVVSFLTPLEFRDLNLVNKGLYKSTSIVLAKIKMHAFKCAMEVIVAFKLGYLEDARELAALYISHGVPIYSSRCLGHAYHTIHWRMKIEAQQNNSELQDPFYGTARAESRSRNRYSSDMTYLEEKCLFFDTKKMNIHQHLLDQHLYNEYFVKDEGGKMATPNFNLSADFFHPKKGKMQHDHQESDLDILSRPAPDVLKMAMDKELVVYSASNYSDDIKKHLQSRFQTYQRRLDALLKTSDHAAFEETVLDFWDEFFPHTAGIHYHDLETAVPRISGLQKFLTKPCPKAIGTVQCEIERIKISSRGNGVKGRLFPTYEYRLFIRNKPESEDSPVRRDTVLMVAKNRGRKHAGEATVTTKKGSNNYYLYLPQQRDVDTHFNKVNNLEKPARLVPNGASQNPVLTSDDAGSMLLGRLQSNFIGTEFQIFTPRLGKLQRSCHEQSFASEDDLDYDSGVSSDNNSLRRSRFGRLSLRRAPNSDMSTGSNEDRPRPFVRAMSSPEINYRQPRTNRRAIANVQNNCKRVPVLCEEEDGVITYTANLLGSRPRIMDVCIPMVTPDGVAGVDWQRYLSSCEVQEEGHMLSCFRQLLQQREESEEENNEEPNIEENDFGLMALQNRPPWWNVEVGSFVLNFGGRVSVASVKNFQLCEKTNQDRIMLQFGRIMGRHSFTMDFQHPLTAVQAFSIAVSSLQSKISFG